MATMSITISCGRLTAARNWPSRTFRPLGATMAAEFALQVLELRRLFARLDEVLRFLS